MHLKFAGSCILTLEGERRDKDLWGRWRGVLDLWGLSALFWKHSSWKTVWASDKKPNSSPRQTQRNIYRQSLHLSDTFPPSHETIICPSWDVGGLTRENRTRGILSLLPDIFILFINYTVIHPNCLSYAELGMMPMGYHYCLPASSSGLAVL